MAQAFLLPFFVVLPLVFGKRSLKLQPKTFEAQSSPRLI
jgi:hypothetical protein